MSALRPKLEPRYLWVFLLITLMLSLAACNFPEANSFTQTIENPLTAVNDSTYHIAPEFQAFYQSLSNPLTILGKPISLAFIDPDTDNLVQYFQKAKLELHLGEQDQAAILLAKLGNYFGQQASGQEVIIESECRLYPESEHPICGQFLNFYEENDLAPLFGKPITNIFLTDQHYVQYFENAMLIWDPNAPPSYQVTVANLGEIYLKSFEPLFHQVTLDPELFLMIPEKTPVENFIVSVSFKYPLIRPDHTQIVFVQVLDSNGMLIPKAELTGTIALPDGSQLNLRPGITDQHGVLSFPIPPLDFTFSDGDNVEVAIFAKMNDQTGQSIGSYTILE